MHFGIRCARVEAGSEAARAGVAMRTVASTYGQFDFGKAQWDQQPRAKRGEDPRRMVRFLARREAGGPEWQEATRMPFGNPFPFQRSDRAFTFLRTVRKSCRSQHE
jgi:hypothetical protein